MILDVSHCKCQMGSSIIFSTIPNHRGEIQTEGICVCLAETLRSSYVHYEYGLATKLNWAADSGVPNLPTPNSDLSLDFGHFDVKTL